MWGFYVLDVFYRFGCQESCSIRGGPMAGSELRFLEGWRVFCVGIMNEVRIGLSYGWRGTYFLGFASGFRV